MNQKVTISQIAHSLDISSSTVSRALRGDLKVNSETRAKVMKTATEMGYFKPKANDLQFYEPFEPTPGQNVVTMKDLAKGLNVSVSTVSRALSHPHNFPNATVERVKKAALTMGYSFNLNARKLVSRVESKGSSTVPTIYTISQALGLSPATVSRSFSPTSPIAAKTRERVLAKANELGYVPNHDAAMLKSGKPKKIPNNPATKKKRSRRNLVAILTPSLSHPAVYSIVSGIEQVLGKRNIRIMLVKLGLKKRDFANSALKLFEKLVDGVIYLPVALNRREQLSSLTSKPLIVVGSFVDLSDALTIRVDQFNAVYQGTSLLLNKGCGHVLLVDPGRLPDHMRRKAGFEKAHFKNDLAPNADQILHVNEPSQYLKKVIAQVKGRGHHCDGLILIDFVLDESILRLLQNLDIPAENIVVIEMEAGSTDIRAPSTTHQVYCSYEDMGKCGAQIMIKLLQSRSTDIFCTEVAATIVPAMPRSRLHLIHR